MGRPVYLHPDLRHAPHAVTHGRDAARRVRDPERLTSDNGQLIFRAFHRVDGRPILTDAMRLLVHSAT